MVTATINIVLDLSKSFYARVGGDYRIYLPKEIRDRESINEGDLVWLVVGTVIHSKSRPSIIFPGEER